jgi:hypothetical protein
MSSWGSAQLEAMTVRIKHVDLIRTIGTRPARGVLDSEVLKMRLPLTDIVDHEGPVIAAAMCAGHGTAPFTDQVQLLVRP